MNSEQTLQASLKNERAIFISTLRSLSLIDIGTIVSVKEGRALVHGSSFSGGKQLVYQDAEIVFPGNRNGAYSTTCAGTPCLIFIPCSCMPHINDKKVRFTAPPYHKAGVKVMPIGNGVDNPISVKFDDSGTYSISSEKYGVVFRSDSMGVFRPDGASSIEMTDDGNIYVSRQGDSSCVISIEDGQTTVSCEQNHVQWDISVQEGKLLLTQKDANNVNLSSITIDASGNASINAKAINLNGDSKRLVTFSELQQTLSLLWTALTTTPIAGNGSLQPTWVGLTNLDISNAQTTTIKTGG